MVGMMMTGVDDRVAGGILACVVAADLGHPTGIDSTFAYWLAAWNLDDEFGRGDRRVVSEPYTPAAVRAKELAEGLLRLLALDAYEDEDDQIEDGTGLPAGLAGAVDTYTQQSEQKLPLLSSINGLSVDRIVELGARAGASMFPGDWWRTRSLGDPELRGLLINRATTNFVQNKHRYEPHNVHHSQKFLDRAMQSRSARRLVEHPIGDVWFGNPLDVLDVPRDVDAVICLGRALLGVTSAHVAMQITLPWLSDDYDSPAAGNGDRDLWLGLDYSRQEIITCGPSHERSPEPFWSTAINSAVGMIQQMRSTEIRVLVVGDWSGSALHAIWLQLSAVTGLESPYQSGEWVGDDPHDAYKWEHRVSRYGVSTPADSASSEPQPDKFSKTIETPAGADFYGMPIGSRVTQADRVAALVNNTPPASMRDLLDQQAEFVVAKAQGDTDMATWHEQRFKELFKVVMDVELLGAMDVMDVVDAAVQSGDL